MQSDSQKIAFAAPNLRRAIVYAALASRPGPKVDHLSGIDQLMFATHPVESAIKRLKRVLFPWMVLDFQGQPTKTKAICIFDMFLANGDQSDDSYSKLLGQIRMARQNSELAKSMSWMKRIATSSNRTVDSNIFDDMLKLHLFGSSLDKTFYALHQQQFRDIVSTPPTTNLSRDLSAAVRAIQQTCKTAGFSLKGLGLSDSFA